MTERAPLGAQAHAPERAERGRASDLAPDPLGIMAFHRDLQFASDHQDPVPDQLHVAGVWSDESGGSALGSPALQREWRDWLERGAHAVRVEQVDERCHHPGITPADQKRGVICPSCALLDSDGKAIAQTGVRSRSVAHYRWPMRAAMARASHARRRKGCPDAGAVVFAILAAGDWRLAMHRLSYRYPTLASPLWAFVVARDSLAEVRRRYRSEAPERVARPKSDAQLDAEASR